MLENCQYSVRLINRLQDLDKDHSLDYDLINKSIDWAKKYHGDQKRKSGESYYTHPLEVAYMVSEYNLKTDVIITAILHDIVEDTEVTCGMILDGFGFRIMQMVDLLTRDRPDGTKLSVEQILDNAYEQDDKEVILIKIVDRLHNMMTLPTNNEEKCIKKTKKTFEDFIIYTIYLDNAKLIKTIQGVCQKYIKQEKHNNLNMHSHLIRTTSQLPSLNSQSVEMKKSNQSILGE